MACLEPWDAELEGLFFVWFGVWGLGFGDLGFRVWDLVQNSEFRYSKVWVLLGEAMRLLLYGVRSFPHNSKILETVCMRTQLIRSC